jgi:hypothetical protein
VGLPAKLGWVPFRNAEDAVAAGLLTAGRSKSTTLARLTTYFGPDQMTCGIVSGGRVSGKGVGQLVGGMGRGIVVGIPGAIAIFAQTDEPPVLVLPVNEVVNVRGSGEISVRLTLTGDRSLKFYCGMQKSASLVRVIEQARSQSWSVDVPTAQAVVPLAAPVVVSGYYLGGYGIQIQPEALVAWRFAPDMLHVSGDGSDRDLRYETLEAIEIAGPDRVVQGGGFIGGGFGLEGAVVGIALASLLNNLTTKVTYQTFLRIVAADYEACSLVTDRSPQQLDVDLAGVRAYLRKRPTVALLPDPSVDPLAAHEARFCIKCGDERALAARFCGSCGHPF